MRRYYVFGALFVVIATAATVTLVGCDRSDGAPARPGDVVLTVMFAPDSTGVWRSLCTSFEQQHPHIRINLIEGPSATKW